MRLGWMAAAAAMVCAAPASATTWIRYEFAGAGTATIYTQDSDGRYVTNGPFEKHIIISFVVDVDQYPTSTYVGVFPGLGAYSQTATGSPTTISASGRGQPDSRASNNFGLFATIDGVVPYGTFVQSLLSPVASGTMSYSDTIAPGYGYPSTRFYTATINTASITQVAAFAGFNALAVPEPAAWTMMILGVGAIGGTMRRRTRVTTRVNFA